MPLSTVPLPHNDRALEVETQHDVVQSTHDNDLGVRLDAVAEDAVHEEGSDDARHARIPTSPPGMWA